jgi:hypothetical protein
MNLRFRDVTVQSANQPDINKPRGKTYSVTSVLFITVLYTLLPNNKLFLTRKYFF